MWQILQAVDKYRSFSYDNDPDILVNAALILFNYL